VQALLAVRDWNFWLSACASLPFCALNPDPEEADELVTALGVGEGGVLPADVAADEVAWAAESDAADEVTWAPESDEEEGAAEEFCDVPFPAPLPPGTPGDWTRSSSCAPAVIGPDGFAGQLPGGFRGPFWPNGIVPGAPAELPSANFVGFTPWNWHWKSPLSSAFRGFCWQYGILREFGWQFTKRTKIG
jgi:hypothetical protein